MKLLHMGLQSQSWTSADPPKTWRLHTQAAWAVHAAHAGVHTDSLAAVELLLPALFFYMEFAFDNDQ